MTEVDFTAAPNNSNGADTHDPTALRRGHNGKLVRNHGDGRPIVQRGDDIHRVIDDLDEAIADDPRLFQRCGDLVTARGMMVADAKRLKIKDFDPAMSTMIVAKLHPGGLLPRITE